MEKDKQVENVIGGLVFAAVLASVASPIALVAGALAIAGVGQSVWDSASQGNKDRIGIELQQMKLQEARERMSMMKEMHMMRMDQMRASMANAAKSTAEAKHAVNLPASNISPGRQAMNYVRTTSGKPQQSAQDRASTNSALNYAAYKQEQQKPVNDAKAAYYSKGQGMSPPSGPKPPNNTPPPGGGGGSMAPYFTRQGGGEAGPISKVKEFNEGLQQKQASTQASISSVKEHGVQQSRHNPKGSQPAATHGQASPTQKADSKSAVGSTAQSSGTQGQQAGSGQAATHGQGKPASATQAQPNQTQGVARAGNTQTSNVTQASNATQGGQQNQQSRGQQLAAEFKDQAKAAVKGGRTGGCVTANGKVNKGGAAAMKTGTGVEGQQGKGQNQTQHASKNAGSTPQNQNKGRRT